MAYTNVHSQSLDLLAAEVERLQADGWVTAGSMTVAPVAAVDTTILINISEVQYRLMYFQTMIK